MPFLVEILFQRYDNTEGEIHLGRKAVGMDCHVCVPQTATK